MRVDFCSVNMWVLAPASYNSTMVNSMEREKVIDEGVSPIPHLVPAI